MTLFEAVFLGAVQGITEFLPISSSGHLVILQSALGITEGAFTFGALIHFGSLAAVIIAFRVELWTMVYGMVGGQGEVGQAGRKLFVQLLFATLPLVVVGLFFRNAVDQAFTSIYVPVFMLYVTGIFLFLAERSAQRERDAGVEPKHVLWMGISQMFAVLPGLSRAGSTMAAGILTGLDRHSAARFSFLMSIPATLGASLLEARQIFRTDVPAVLAADVALAGVLVSGVTSYLVIKVLLRYLQHGSLKGFVYYTFILATTVLAIVRLQDT